MPGFAVPPPRLQSICEKRLASKAVWSVTVPTRAVISPGICPAGVLLKRGCGSAADGAVQSHEDPMPKSKSVKSGKLLQSKSKHHKSNRLSTRTPVSRQRMRSRMVGTTSIADPGPGRPVTKQARVIAMLCAPAGATIDAIMQVTNWQQHSVRGFLTAVVRKKLGFDLLSEAAESGRIYRINGQRASSSASTKTAA